MYSKNEELILKNFLKENEETRKFVSFHIVFAKKDEFDDPRKVKELELSFPINYLRNVARIHSKTEFIFYLDGDFIVTETLKHDIQSKSFQFVNRKNSNN